MQSLSDSNLIDNLYGRLEDLRFVSGRGRYTGDLVPENTLHAVFFRSSVAAGKIKHFDCEQAKIAPGVISIFTATDIAKDGITEMVWTGVATRDDGGRPIKSPRPILSNKQIRHVGEPIAMIVAKTKQSALDALDLIEVDIENASSVSLSKCNIFNGPFVWPGSKDNIAALHRIGDRRKVEEKIKLSHHVTTFEFNISKVTACPIEMRNSIGIVDSDEQYCLITSAQSPYAVQTELAQLFKVDEKKIRVIAPDVGGSFGMKGGLFREDALVLWASKRLKRPVCWLSERSEAFLSDEYARAVSGSASLGLDDNGNFTSLWVDAYIDAGAYLSRRTKSLVNNIGGIAGQYTTPNIAGELTFYFTNTMQTAPYRGAGRPEATFIIERLIDKAAKEIGKDALSLRLQNLIQPDAMPYQTPLSFKYDSGNFPLIVQTAAKKANYQDFVTRRVSSENKGLLRGIGIANPIEVAGGPIKQLKKDVARLTAKPDGQILIAPGFMSVGQGHETTMSRMIAERLGVKLSSIVYEQGDTKLLPSGRGSGGSASTIIGGSAVHKTLDEFLVSGKKIAAKVMECKTEEIVFDTGYFYDKKDRSKQPMNWADIASHSNASEGFSVLSEFLPEDVTYPNGCHICELEIDPNTGYVSFADYVVVEDVGTVLNADLVEGQMHGGIAQGISQALGENLKFDQNGQLITGSFLDYQIPIAADFPFFRISTLPVPTKVNPLGAKGVGEAGTVGALAATMNAICDALACAGVDDFEMPATPSRIWHALQKAKS